MIRLALIAAGASAAATLGGCVVAPPPADRYVEPAPVAQPARPYRIAGFWAWENQRGRPVEVDIRRERGGLVATRRNGRSDFYQRVGPGIFEDERGRRYEFLSDREALFIRPNGRTFRMIRI